MDFEAYKNPDQSELISKLREAVDVFIKIAELNEPLRILKQIELDSKEYDLLCRDMKKLNFYSDIKKVLETYKNDRRSLGYQMDLIGNEIDRGYGHELTHTGKTFTEYHNILRAAYLLDKNEKKYFLKRYDYLVKNGAQDLIKFKEREEKNKTLKEDALNKCPNRNPRKQVALIEKLQNEFRFRSYMPSMLYFACFHLYKHMTKMLDHNTFDEITKAYLTSGELRCAENGVLLNIYHMTMEDKYRVEGFIKNIAYGNIKLSEIPVKTNEDENQTKE